MWAGLDALLASGHAVDLILGLLLVEVLALIAYRRVTGRGVPLADVATTALSGACLLLALRAALVGWSPAWIVLCLAGALVAHLADLRRRLRAE